MSYYESDAIFVLFFCLFVILKIKKDGDKMKNHKQIFLLYSCDAWKSNDSMKLLTATTSTTRLRRFIESKIMSGDMRYADSGETYCGKKAVQQFRTDWKTITRAGINSQLDEGFIDYVYDGEEI